MKLQSHLFLFALCSMAISSLQAQAPAAGTGLMAPPSAPIPPTPPPGMADPNAAYTGMSPTLGAPTVGSPYAGPTMADPNANYGYTQPIPTNNWGGSIQGSMYGSPPMLTYRYIELSYRYTNPEVPNTNGGHGIGITLSVELNSMFFIKGSINYNGGTGERDARTAANADYELSTISIAGGAHMPLTNKLHFVGEVGLIYANFQADGINRSYTDAGIYIRPSLRYQVVDWIELQAGVTISSASDYDSKVIDVGGYFRVMPKLDLNVGADFGDETRSFKAGGRLRW